MTALEVYLLASLFFVIATLFEFAIVLQLYRSNILSCGSSVNIEAIENMTNCNGGLENSDKLNKRSLRSHGRTSTTRIKSNTHNTPYKTTNRIDFCSFFSFMFLYIVFNCIYFKKYTDFVWYCRYHVHIFGSPDFIIT